MEALSKALAYTIAYLGSVVRETGNDADNDVGALEDIAALIDELTPPEKASLQAAAGQAIAEAEKAEQPNYNLIEGYHSILEHLAEQEG